MASQTTILLSFEEILDQAKSRYKEKFGSNPDIACCAPGRVNLIGEHIDYNDGFALPIALPMVTIIVGSSNNTPSKVNIVTCCPEADEPKEIATDVRTVQPGVPKWANYVKGVIANFGQPIPGFNAVIHSNVPVGGGLSSSAALEVSTLTFLQKLTGILLKSDGDRALVCQKAEHTYAGMPCGIMDQLVSVSGKLNNALLIDCRSLETVQIPFVVKDLAILICNSNVRHELSDSEYPTRRKQCTKAKELMGLNSYRDATEAHLSPLNQEEEILLKRARHVITEIKRTNEAAEALRQHNFRKMGELMTKSHISLRDDFEVSCKELDILVDSAINCSGVLGSRMTGGGFGGCTVTLLQRNSIDKVIEKMRADFSKSFQSQQLDFYVCTPSDGARVLQQF